MGRHDNRHFYKGMLDGFTGGISHLRDLYENLKECGQDIPRLDKIAAEVTMLFAEAKNLLPTPLPERETLPSIVKVQSDPDAADPCSCGWMVYSFNSRHRHFRDPEDIGLSLEQDRKKSGQPIVLDTELKNKLKHGFAFWLSYYEHGDCRWYLESGGAVDEFDGRRWAGLLVWSKPAAEMWHKTKAKRKAAAEKFIEAFTGWVNGHSAEVSLLAPDDEAVDYASGHNLETALASLVASSKLKGRTVEVEGELILLEMARTELESLGVTVRVPVELEH